MSGYVHREPGRVSRAEAVKSHTVYNLAVAQDDALITQARKQAHQIRTAAIMRAEQDAKAIREAARAEGIASVSGELADTEDARRAAGRKRLAEITKEKFTPKPKDTPR